MRTQRLWTIRTESPVYKSSRSATNSTEITATENWWAKHSIHTFTTNQRTRCAWMRRIWKLGFAAPKRPSCWAWRNKVCTSAAGHCNSTPRSCPVEANKNQHQAGIAKMIWIFLEVQYNLLILNLFGLLNLFWRRLSCKGEVWNQDLVRDDLRSNFTIDLALGLHTKQFHRLSYLLAINQCCIRQEPEVLRVQKQLQVVLRHGNWPNQQQSRCKYLQTHGGPNAVKMEKAWRSIPKFSLFILRHKVYPIDFESISSHFNP